MKETFPECTQGNCREELMGSWALRLRGRLTTESSKGKRQKERRASELRGREWEGQEAGLPGEWLGASCKNSVTQDKSEYMWPNLLPEASWVWFKIKPSALLRSKFHILLLLFSLLCNRKWNYYLYFVMLCDKGLRSIKRTKLYFREQMLSWWVRNMVWSVSEHVSTIVRVSFSRPTAWSLPRKLWELVEGGWWMDAGGWTLVMDAVDGCW